MTVEGSKPPLSFSRKITNMKVVKPYRVSINNYTRIGPWDIGVTTHLPWSVVAYNANDTVEHLGYFYRAIVNVTGDDIYRPPSENPSVWEQFGTTNAQAPFDNQTSTSATFTYSSSSPVPLSYDFLWFNGTGVPVIDTIGIFNIQGCQRVVVEVTKSSSGGTTTATYEKVLNAAFIGDWYDYFFAENVFLNDAIFENIAPALAEDLYIRIYFYPAERSAGFPGETFVMSVGSIVLGKSITLGQTQMGPRAGIVDYSRKETDQFGTTTFVKRAFSKRASYSVFAANSDLNRIFSLLSSLRAEPCLWIGTSEEVYGPLNVFGYYKDFNIDIQYVNHSLISIDVEGLA